MKHSMKGSALPKAKGSRKPEFLPSARLQAQAAAPVLHLLCQVTPCQRDAQASRALGAPYLCALDSCYQKQARLDPNHCGGLTELPGLRHSAFPKAPGLGIQVARVTLLESCSCGPQGLTVQSLPTEQPQATSSLQGSGFAYNSYGAPGGNMGVFQC